LRLAPDRGTIRLRMSLQRILAVIVLSVSLALNAWPQSRKPAAPKPTQRELLRSRDLTKKINALLAITEASRGFWGIEIVSLDSGRTLFELNADRLFTPASNTKLFTTAAALELLGPDYRFRTSVESTGTLDATGRLSGDVLLIGRGDPNISGRVLPYNLNTEWLLPKLGILEQLADQVAAKQIKIIDGDIVGDDSWFAYQRYGAGWAQDDLMWPDGAPASALTLNDNTQTLTVLPGSSAGAPATVMLDPDIPYYEIDNRVTTTAAGVGPRAVGMDRQPGSRTLVLWGTVPLDDTGSAYAVAIDDPAQFAAMAFHSMLAQRGIRVLGKERAHHTLTASLPLNALNVDTNSLAGKGGSDTAGPPEQQHLVLAVHESALLIEDLRIINKISQNLHAELVLRTIGRERGTAPTLEGSLAVVNSVLVAAGLERGEFEFFDGSGMSLQNLVTPRGIVKLLRHAHAASWGDLFRSTLPVSGVDGSIADRFKGTVAHGRIQAKTGTLGHVNTLAGYAQTAKGEHLVFAIMCNNHKLTSSGAKMIIDKIAETIVDDKPPPPRKRKKRPAKS
jgi:serine-type D-Ala-D-Ala carboxypeptidase/endopeptidase (penicillin-binding protein 4)